MIYYNTLVLSLVLISLTTKHTPFCPIIFFFNYNIKKSWARGNFCLNLTTHIPVTWIKLKKRMMTGFTAMTIREGGGIQFLKCQLNNSCAGINEEDVEATVICVICNDICNT